MQKQSMTINVPVATLEEGLWWFHIVPVYHSMPL